MNPFLKILVIIVLLVALIGAIFFIFPFYDKRGQKDRQHKQSSLIKRLTLKYDINKKELIFYYHKGRLYKNVVPLAKFEATLSDAKLQSFHQFLDSCVAKEEGCKEHIDIKIMQEPLDFGVWYELSLARYNEKKGWIFFNLKRKSPIIQEIIYDQEILAFSDFKYKMKTMSDYSYKECGTIFAISILPLKYLANRYDSDVTIVFLEHLITDLRKLSDHNTLLSVENNHFWIYHHNLVNKALIKEYLFKIKKTLSKYVTYGDLILTNEFNIGYSVLGKFTFSVDVATKQALQACESIVDNVFNSSKDYLEYNELMERLNSNDYADYQALNQLINFQEFTPVFNYLFSLYNGMIQDYVVELDISSTYFKGYNDAYECALRNDMLDTFIEAGFKSILNTITQYQVKPNNFIYIVSLKHAFNLIDIYNSNEEYRVYPFTFVIDDFYTKDNEMVNEIKEKILFYKSKDLKFGLMVDDKMKMTAHPLFSLFDIFVIPPQLYKGIKNDEKARLNAIRTVEVLPFDANVVLIGANDKVQVEILMGGDIDYVSGPLVGSTIDLNEKPDIVVMRKLQSLLKLKEIYE